MGKRGSKPLDSQRGKMKMHGVYLYDDQVLYLKHRRRETGMSMSESIRTLIDRAEKKGW